MPPFDLTSELPAPRDDEPASLRGDIAAELADHLACSLARERVKTADEDHALRIVLHKFGNPASIARKLWWDAMWEKIMLQRVSTILATAAAFAALAVCLLLWQALSDARELQAQQLAKFESSLAALVDELRKRPDSPADSNWAEVTVKLVREDGTPAKGKVFLLAMPAPSESESELARLRDSATHGTAISGSAGDDGVARLSGVPYEKYQLYAVLEDPACDSSQQVFVRPGNQSFQFLCPNRVPIIQVRAEFQPPEDLKDLPFRYSLDVIPDYNLQVRDTSWMARDVQSRPLMFGADGRFLGQSPHDQNFPPGYWTEQDLLREPLLQLTHQSSAYYSHIRFYSQVPAPNNADAGAGRKAPADAWFQAHPFTATTRDQARSPSRTLSAGENLIRIGPQDPFWEFVRDVLQTGVYSVGDIRMARLPNGTFQPIGKAGEYRFGGGLSEGLGGPGFGGGGELTALRGIASAASRRGGSGRGNLMAELRRGDIAAFIALADEQVQQLDSIREQTLSRQASLLNRTRNAPTEEERAAATEEYQQWQQTILAQNDADVLQLLTANQKTRFDSIRLQKTGPLLLTYDEALRGELGVSPEQLQAMQTILEETTQRLPGMDLEMRQILSDQCNLRVLEVLSAEQREAWNKKLGPPIDFSALPSPSPGASGVRNSGQGSRRGRVGRGGF